MQRGEASAEEDWAHYHARLAQARSDARTFDAALQDALRHHQVRERPSFRCYSPRPIPGNALFIISGAAVL